MRRGCVTAITPVFEYPASCKITGIWVVFPEPVGLCTTIT